MSYFFIQAVLRLRTFNSKTLKEGFPQNTIESFFSSGKVYFVFYFVLTNGTYFVFYFVFINGTNYFSTWNTVSLIIAKVVGSWLR